MNLHPETSQTGFKSYQKRIHDIRKDFPILGRQVHGNKKLVFLDSAASSQKPTSVIEAMDRFYFEEYANVHRGVYALSVRATEKYEEVRVKLGRFFGTTKEHEWIFGAGTTALINLIATGWGERHVQAGDEIVVTRLEHHANFVPWQQLCLRKKAKFTIIELTDRFEVDLEAYVSALKRGPKLVAFSHMSNVLGTVNPVAKMATMAKEAGAVVVVDGAQSVAHLPFKMGDLGPIDFFVFSAHKVLGPTGIGAMWANEAVLKQMDPYQFGGDMILKVSDDVTVFNGLPTKFEAGTPNFVGAVGLAAGLEYMQELGRDWIHDYETFLCAYALEKLTAIRGLSIKGPMDLSRRGSVISFTVDGIHPHDLATLLDLDGISVRAGHHCAQPLMNTLKVAATTRASFSFYNLPEEVDALVNSIETARKVFS